MATRVVIMFPRVLAQSARPTSLLHQLPKASYVMTPQMCRSLHLTRSCSLPITSDKPIDELVAERIKDIKSGKFEKMKDPQRLKHFRAPPSVDAAHSLDPTMVPKDGATTGGKYTLPHPIWTEKEVYSVRETHKVPKRISDWLAYLTVKTLRSGYDFISGYHRRTRDESLWINRIIFIEAISAVPGMVAALVRHVHSIRRMRRDHGWIHTLLEEAENERMHLMTALQLKQPTILFKALLLTSQGLFIIWFGISYLIAPRYSHRLVGYMEEEAVRTFTQCLKDIDDGPLSHWKSRPAPDIAINYWHLPPTATMKDVILAMRADEAHHRVVNHTLASMNKDDFNPYKPGE